jgi:outer membrane protein assembly factor BamB
MKPSDPFHASLLGTCLLLSSALAHADDWPQWRGPTRDGVWKESGVLEKFPEPALKIKWRAPIAGGFCGPTVADGRVFVMDRITEPTETERVHCLDAVTGKNLWLCEYPCRYEIDYPQGPRASVTIDEGLAYALGAMGHLHCLEASTGRVVWMKDLKTEYAIDIPIWGISSAPLVVGGLVILHIGGANGACILALDKKSGTEKWRALDDPASYAAPILIEQAGRQVLVCWTGANVAGISPETGETYWTYPFKPSRMVLNVATPIWENSHLFVSAFYDGSLMLKLFEDKPAVEEVWRRKGINEKKTDSLHSIISTPILAGDFIYGVDSYGELRALNARSGDRVWEDLTAGPNVRWGTLHMVRNAGRVWIFNELGELLIGELSPSGFKEISRAKLIEPTTSMGQRPEGQKVCWAHPAFADRHIFARNDEELVCASLAAE